ncbi:MAG: L-rhamnose mutarotase [Bacteroidota bacterium]
MSSQRYCLALDLKDDPQLIEQYKQYHAPGQVWPEVLNSISESGIQQMEIYHVGNRLFMIMEVDESFSFERKSKMDTANPKVQAWEELMWKFQQALPWAKEGEKWILMEKIFEV